MKLSNKTEKKIRDAIRRAKDEKRPLSLLFVCLGNICRSPAADGIMHDLAAKAGMEDMLIIDSCGFYGGHAGDLPDSRMRQAGRQRGYDFTHRSRTIRPTDFENFDLIFGMDDRNLADLHEAAPTLEAEEKIIPMAELAQNHPDVDAVPDPYWSGADGFYHVLNILEDGCGRLLEMIQNF